MHRFAPLLLVATLAILPSPAMPPAVAAPPPPAVGGFSASLFTFVTTLKDDGEGKGGGWQEASAQLRFVDGRSTIPRIWSCRIKVGMPIRAAEYGWISPEAAAEMTTTVATKASREVMHRRPEWVPILYCIEFIGEMGSLFQKGYDGLGARVSKR